MAIDAASGRKIWQKDVSSFSGVSQGFGNVYVTDDDGTMSAYLRNGQGLRWQQDALSFRELSRPTPVSSYVAVTDFEGVLHLVSQVDGEFVGRTKVGGDGARAVSVHQAPRLGDRLHLPDPVEITLHEVARRELLVLDRRRHIA